MHFNYFTGFNLKQSALVSISIAGIQRHDHKQLEEERVCFILELSDHTPSLWEPREELKAGAWRWELKPEAMEEPLPTGFSICFLLHNMTTCPEVANAHSGQGLYTSIR